jgi:hypothetical protein
MTFLVREGYLKGRYKAVAVIRETPGTFTVDGGERFLKKNPRNVALFTTREVAEDLIRKADEKWDPVIHAAEREMVHTRREYERLLLEKRAMIARVGREIE